MPSGSAGTWDVVVGVCESQINDLIAQVCTISPHYFQTVFPYSDGTLVAVGVNFEATPTVSLSPSSDYLAVARDHLTGMGYKGDLDAGALEMTQACGTLNCSNVQYNFIGMQTGTIVNGSFSCSMALTVSADNMLYMTFSDAHITVPTPPANDPGAVQGISNAVLTWLYDQVTVPFQIPLALPSGNFTPFAVTNDPGSHDDPLILAYSGYAPVVLPPAGGQWPSKSAFIAVDAAVINALANANIAPLSGSGGIPDPNFSWDFHATVQCDADLQQSSGTQVEVSLNVTGGASITWHAPNGIPNPSIGASIYGSCSASTTLSIDNTPAGQSLRLSIDSIGGFDLKLDLGSCPSIIADIINDVVSPLINDIASSLTDNVPGTWYELFTVPPLVISPPNLPPMTISLLNFTPQILTAPAGVNVLGLSGEASITKS